MVVVDDDDITLAPCHSLAPGHEKAQRSLQVGRKQRFLVLLAFPKRIPTAVAACNLTGVNDSV